MLLLRFFPLFSFLKYENKLSANKGNASSKILFSSSEKISEVNMFVVMVGWLRGTHLPDTQSLFFNCCRIISYNSNEVYFPRIEGV